MRSNYCLNNTANMKVQIKAEWDFWKINVQSQKYKIELTKA